MRKIISSLRAVHSGLFIFLLISCSSVGQRDSINNRGSLIYFKTTFYDSLGQPRLSDTLKIWYKDSMAIEEINRINVVTDSFGITTKTNTLVGYRFIDLNNNKWFDYKNFSDTAQLVKSDYLSEDGFKDGGWSFYSDKILQIQGTPQILTDTIMNNEKYKRAKFSFLREDPKRNYSVGYFLCRDKGIMFSIEKSFSSSLNCTMTKLFTYRYPTTRPYGSQEVDFISDTLSTDVLKIFQAWSSYSSQTKNIKKY